jgi:predicted PurR-regulated permease PerM
LWLVKKTKKDGLSAGLTFVAVVFSVAIPVSILVVITVDQALQLVDIIEKASKGSGGLFNTVQNLINNANQQLDKLPSLGPETIKIGQISDWFKENASRIAQSAISMLTGVAGGISSLITKSILFIFVFLSLLKNQQKIFDIIHTLNPLGDKSTKRYLSKMGAMTTAMVKGQFMIAIAQGFVDALLLKIVGVDFFIFWFVLITFLSIIPLGGGIIVIPMGVVLILTGHIWQGLLLILGHILIVTNIDNVLRPKFVPKTARLDSALLMMSVFAGIGLFGFLGIVIGPVLMIVTVTTIDNYIDFVKYTKSVSKKS